MSVLKNSQRATGSGSDHSNRVRALALVHLNELMEITSGSPDVAIGFIDGPVDLQDSRLSIERIRESPLQHYSGCKFEGSIACMHGTHLAGLLNARRNSDIPGMCPECTLFVKPVFQEQTVRAEELPVATPEQLAAAIVECVRAGAVVINMSLALKAVSQRSTSIVLQALEMALHRGAIVVAAAGNQARLGGSLITQHPAVIPVSACGLDGRPIASTNIGIHIGRNGIIAPGDGIESLGPNQTVARISGTSVSAVFVTGTIALLKSAFPKASPSEIKASVLLSPLRKASVIPVLLDAWQAYKNLRELQR